MNEFKDKPKPPLWIQIGTWGVPTRGLAWAYVWLCLVLAVGCFAYTFMHKRFSYVGPISSPLFLLAALLYYATLRWRDKHNYYEPFSKFGHRLGCSPHN